MYRTILRFLSRASASLFIAVCLLGMVDAPESTPATTHDPVQEISEESALEPAEVEAAESEQEPVPERKPLPEALAARFDQALADFELQKEDVTRLAKRAESMEGAPAKILGARRDRLWAVMSIETLEFALNVSAQEEKGVDVDIYRERLIEELKEFPDETYATLERLGERVVFPSPDLEPGKFVTLDQKLFKLLAEVDDVYRALITYVRIAEQFGLDAVAEKAFLEEKLEDSIANRSVFLELALDDVTMLRSAIATLPNNENLVDWLSAAQTRVEMTAKSMQGMIGLMKLVDLETRQYRQQVLTATGEITSDVLDVGIVASLAAEWGKTSLDLILSEGPRLIFRLLLVLFILFVFFQVSKLVQKGVERGLNSSRIRISHLLKRMIISLVRNFIMILGILIAISQLGVSLGPLLAGLGIAGFIIGFALQDSLSNFASGLMILMYRPFDVGDVVDANGVRGRVSQMSLVNTTFLTLDNQRLIVPNNLIWQSVITNVTAQRTRRIDLMFGIAYSDDLEKAEKILLDIVEKHEAVLDDPEPVVKLHELGESSVNFIVRPWVNTNVYWDTYWDLTKQVKLRFDEEGISIPFPQRDVHVIDSK
jgi:small conductance mechanosensitive channel